MAKVAKFTSEELTFIKNKCPEFWTPEDDNRLQHAGLDDALYKLDVSHLKHMAPEERHPFVLTTFNGFKTLEDAFDFINKAPLNTGPLFWWQRAVFQGH